MSAVFWRLISAAEVALIFIDFQWPAFEQAPANSRAIYSGNRVYKYHEGKKKYFLSFLNLWKLNFSSTKTSLLISCDYIMPATCSCLSQILLKGKKKLFICHYQQKIAIREAIRKQSQGKIIKIQLFWGFKDWAILPQKFLYTFTKIK